MSVLILKRRWLLPAVLLGVLAACQSVQQVSPPRVAAAGGAAARHVHATVYALDAAQSTITLKVYRDGPLARFGHNHVITATQISGTVFRERDPLRSEVELSFPAAGLQVDEPAARAAAGTDFPGALTPAAIAGTRENMLGPRLLAAAQFPQIALRTLAVTGTWPDLQLLVEVNVRGLTSQLLVPVHVAERDDRLIADGRLSISQVQLGLSPYSVLGGGLRVRDAIEAEFHLVANRKVAE